MKRLLVKYLAGAFFVPRETLLSTRQNYDLY